jgi:hypothetical protein
MAIHSRESEPTLERVVYPRSDSEWVNERIGSEVDTSIHPSREEAIDFAVAMVEHAGGGQVTVRDFDGEVEYQKTVRPNGGSSRVSIGRGSEDENSFDVGGEPKSPEPEPALSVKGRQKSRPPEN